MTEASDLKRRTIDGYNNLATMLGTLKDRSRYSRFDAVPRLGRAELEELYEQSALHATVVDRMVDDGTRDGFFDIVGGDDSFDKKGIMSAFEDRGVIDWLGDGWRWGRLYGGSLLIPMVEGLGNDERDLSEPFDLGRVRGLNGFRVAESPFVMADEVALGGEFYTVMNPTNSDALKVHKSRAIRFDGVKVAPIRMIQYGGWGPSVLERPRTSLQMLGDAMGYAHTLLHTISIQVFKLTGLREMQTGTAQDKATARAAMESITDSIDNLHAAFLDAGDDYQVIGRTISGINELLDQFVAAAVRDSYHPRSILTGEQPNGQNANGRTEEQVWDKRVNSGQSKDIKRPLSMLVQLVGKVDGIRVPEQFEIKFEPLSMPTPKEEAETNKLQAETDAIYIASQVEAADEVRQRRIDAGELQPGTAPIDSGET